MQNLLSKSKAKVLFTPILTCFASGEDSTCNVFAAYALSQVNNVRGSVLRTSAPTAALLFIRTASSNVQQVEPVAGFCSIVISDRNITFTTGGGSNLRVWINKKITPWSSFDCNSLLLASSRERTQRQQNENSKCT